MDAGRSCGQLPGCRSSRGPSQEATRSSGTTTEPEGIELARQVADRDEVCPSTERREGRNRQSVAIPIPRPRVFAGIHPSGRAGTEFELQLGVQPRFRTLAKQSGFSAIELTIALAITGLILVVGYRSVTDVIPKLRARQAVNDLATAIRAVRAQAILERKVLTMPIDVNLGRYVVVARMAPGNVEQETTVDGVRRVARLPVGLRFATPATVTGPAVTLRDLGGYDPAVVFNAKGQVRTVTLPGYIHLKDDRDQLYWRLVVERAGNIRIQRWNGTRFK